MISDEYAATLGKQIDELEDKMSEWIKVEDGLPLDMESVLASVIERDMYFSRMGEAFVDGETWYWGCGD